MVNKTNQMLIRSAIAVFASILMFTTSTEGFEDGDFVKISNVADGNVLTVSGTDPLAEAHIKAQPWQNLPNQKWLAVQAVVASDNYLLLPQRQHWNWNRFINRGVVPRQTKDRDMDLPDWTMVLTFHANSLIQQARHGKGNQQWKSVDIKSSGGKILIKSIANGKCLRSSGNQDSAGVNVRTTTPSPSFFQSAKSKFQSIFRSGSKATTTTSTTTATPIPSANTNVDAKTKDNVILADCDELDKKQQWTLEKLTNLLI